MSDPFVVFASITPKPQHFDAAKDAIVGIMAATRAEPGCQTFELHKDRESGNRLHLYEVWDDETAFAAHHDQPYTKAVFDHYRDWLALPVDITSLRRI